MRLKSRFSSCSFITFFLLQFHSRNCSEIELTIFIEPGKEECFYQYLNVTQELEIDYQVLSGGQGELDINFHFFSPGGVPLISDDKTEDNSHRWTVTEEGVYKLCYDNYFSHFNPKTVFFSVYIDSNKDWQDTDSFESGDELHGMVKSVWNVLVKTHNDLTKIRQTQEIFRANEARDRNLVERNFSRVNNFSAIQIILMMFVGLVQVALIRGLLDPQSKFHKVWSLFCVLW